MPASHTIDVTIPASRSRVGEPSNPATSPSGCQNRKPKARRHAIRRFSLVRHADVTGISGTGTVAAGVQMPSGRVVLEWVASARDAGRPGALNYYESLEDMIATHSHNGMTSVVWID